MNAMTTVLSRCLGHVVYCIPVLICKVKSELIGSGFLQHEIRILIIEENDLINTDVDV